MTVTTKACNEIKALADAFKKLLIDALINADAAARNIEVEVFILRDEALSMVAIKVFNVL